jgi:ABC-type dipeptide/oligopeptide/nickel transport system permease subunit
MANKKFWLGILVMVLVFVMVGCASLTWNSPVTESGSISAMKTALNNADAKEIANYTVLFGTFELGRSSFDGLVIAAARSGKSIHILRTHSLFVSKIIAYATN